MALGEVTIISNAITKLGHRPIITLDSGDDLVVAAQQAYSMLLPAVLAKNNWRFAVQIQQLSQSVETAPFPWQTIYLLPADWIKTIRVYPNLYVWDIYENSKIYAQYQGDFWMEYVFQPDVNKLPPHFVEYFVNELACYLALSNAERMDYFEVLKQERTNSFAMCAAIEAQNRPQFSQYDFPVLSQRNIGTIIGNSI
jgi:hypothetical protein